MVIYKLSRGQDYVLYVIKMGRNASPVCENDADIRVYKRAVSAKSFTEKKEMLAGIHWFWGDAKIFIIQHNSDGTENYYTMTEKGDKEDFPVAIYR